MSRAAAATGGLLAVLLGLALLTARPEVVHARVLLATFALAGVVMAARLWSGNCPESRVTSAMLGAACAGGTLLSITVGLPGAEPVPLGWLSAGVLTSGSLVPVLLWVDGASRRRSRGRPRRRGRRPETPYAA